MNINEYIKERRKTLGLSQKDLAKALQVSIPAVSKWESSNSYPDITLLPYLARVLKVDLNTLFDYEKELSKEKIGQIVNSVSERLYKDEYSEVFEMAKQYISKYPGDDILLSSLAMVLNGGLHFKDLQDKEQYQSQLDNWYIGLSKSSVFEIKTSAIQMLIISAQNKKDFTKAREYIDSLASVPYKKKHLELNMALAKEDYQQALVCCQEELLGQVVELQNSLVALFEIYMKLNLKNEAKSVNQTLINTINNLDYGAFLKYSGSISLAISENDEDELKNLIKKSMVEMKKEVNLSGSLLYSKINQKDTQLFNDDMIMVMIKEIIKGSGNENLLSENELKALMDSI